MEVFVTKALKKIRKETSRKHKALRDSCDSVLATLAKSAARNSGSAAHDTNADKYFEPFRLACESKKSEIMETSLYCIHNLIAYGYLRGGEAMGEGRRLIDMVVDTVCACNDHTDHGVQLQVIKALLTAVTSSTCEVHETSLLSAVRACYHIHLVSDNLVNKTTAKATLTQMLNVVFQRMESFDLRVRARQNLEQQDGTAGPAGDGSAAAAAAGNAPPPPQPPPPQPPQPSVAAAAEAEASDDTSGAGEVGPTRMRCAYGVGTVVETREDGVCVVRLPYGVLYLGAADSAAAEVLPPGAADAAEANGEGAAPEAAAAPTQAFVSVLHKDAFLLFRALCKLSMKGLPDDPNLQPDRIALQSKILSLELLLSVLDHSGPSFRDSDKFIYAIRTYLCHSLIKNCTSNVPQVVGLSLRIFVALVKHFKEHLKAQIEVFISNIFLCILESPNSTFDHKTKVLEVFHNLSQDPRALVEIFLNYDCDFDSIDLFKRIVHALSKVAKGRAERDVTGNRRTEKEETALRLLGLESLVSIVKSLVDSAQLDKAAEARGALVGAGGGGARAGSAGAVNDDDDDEAEAKAEADGADVEPRKRSDTNTIVGSFATKQRRKDELDTAVLKFNLKPKTGIAFLVEKGHLEKNNPKAVASFLHAKAEELDKTVVGDYLGKEVAYMDGFCVKVLHEYVDMMEFAGMKFDMAIRHFLSGFRLPGEAQKIDRMMEKFAERFCLCNKDMFPSADTAFILAFAVVMLQTDLHNPSIKDERRMTKAGFRSQNRGIANGNDLPADMLDGIYDRLKKEPFSLKEDDDMRAKQGSDDKGGVVSGFFGVGRVDPSRKAEKEFIRERADMSRRGEALLKQTTRRGAGENGRSRAASALSMDTTDYHHLHDLQQEHVAPMFEMAWAPVLAVFSVNLETTEEEQVVELCLDGVHHAIRIAAHFGLDVVRDAFVTSLAKFTTLDTVREMQPKNVACIKTLIKIALKDGNWLGASWAQALTCISQLARLQMFAEGMPADETFFAGPSGGPRASAAQANKPKKGGFFSQPSRREIAKQVEQANAEHVMSEIDALAVDRVFSSSLSLSSDAINNFVEQLCAVSLSELSAGGEEQSGMANRAVMKDVEYKLQRTTEGSGTKSWGKKGKKKAAAAMAYGVRADGAAGGDNVQPRVFSLQKLVEIADLNMDHRSRLVWNKAWQIMSLHFARVGCHRNQSIAMFAIDSLKQLSLKFLSKGELRNFQFQKLFLRPFELIMANSTSTEIRELILSCLGRIILARHQHIRSGWSALFAAFAVGSRDSKNLSLVQLSFESVDNVLRHHFTEPSVLAVFVEIVQCLLSFASNFLSTPISKAALAHLRTCGLKLQQGGVITTHAPSTSVVQQEPAPPAAAAVDDDYEHVDFSGVDVDCAKVDGAAVDAGAADDGSDTEDEGALDDDEEEGVAEEQLQMYSDCDAHLGVWWPLLTGLAALVGDPRREVSALALTSLFDLLEGRLPVNDAPGAPKSTGNPHQFSPKLWELVFKGVLFPLFDDVRHGQGDGQGDAGTGPDLETCMQAMQSMVTLFAKYYSSHLRLLLPDVLRLLHSCIAVPDGMEPLAAGLPEIGVRCLRQLLLNAGSQFSVAVWDGVCQEIAELFEQTSPSDLGASETRAALGLAPADPPLKSEEKGPRRPSTGDALRCCYGSGTVQQVRESDGTALVAFEWGVLYAPSLAAIDAVDESGQALAQDAQEAAQQSQPAARADVPTLPFDAPTVVAKCNVQLQLQEAVGEVAAAHITCLAKCHCKALLDVLYSSYSCARVFNADLPLRQALWVAGFMRSADHPEQLPNLLGQETAGLTQHTRILFQLYTSSNTLSVAGDAQWDRMPFAEGRLQGFCHEVLADFTAKEKKADHLQSRALDGAPGVSMYDPNLAERALPTVAVEAREAADSLVPIVLCILTGALDFSDTQLHRNIGWLYPAFCGLMETNNADIRSALQTFFQQRISALLRAGVKCNV